MSVLRREGRGRAAFAGVTVGVVLAGCSPGPTADDAVAVAQEFFAALTAHDPSTACGLLAPATRESFEQDAVSSCDQALLDGETGLVLGPVARRVEESPADSSVTVAGRQAQVLLGGEVTFLAASGDSWRVTATGCVARADRPYDCLLDGG
ncbi:hypothetical protein ACFRCR_00065 [Oerskovia sp. NPDC056781]|uniref:hypothetical protein n=1 Tax=Oerskovia sp. NPDC056781 TaxID=3345942 RepID=UPI003671F1E8